MSSFISNSNNKPSSGANLMEQTELQICVKPISFYCNASEDGPKGQKALHYILSGLANSLQWMAYYSNNTSSIRAIMPHTKIFTKQTFLVRKAATLSLKLV
jgi:uncharacterized membrane protein